MDYSADNKAAPSNRWIVDAEANDQYEMDETFHKQRGFQPVETSR